MDKGSFKKTSRRLFAELLLVVAIISYKVDFPKGRTFATNWGFVFANPLVLLHIMVATVVLAEAAALLVRSLRSRGRAWIAWSATGFILVLFAYVTGIMYVDVVTRQYLGLMSLGWLGATAVYGVGWFLYRKKKHETTPRHTEVA